MFDRFRSPRPPAEAVVEPVPMGLGTFGGVFTPSILTILGVIMYLRFGWVVGQVGLVGTFAIVTLATLITFLTALSIAAIATDQRVRAGGAYYMISRSLGIETGGAVGMPLYLAQALSIALYRETSADADLVLIGLAQPDPDVPFEDYYTALRERTAGLPATLFVLAAEDIAFGKVLA